AGFGCRRGECVNGCQQGNKPDKCNGVCTNVVFDDKNCGTCGNVCDPTGPNLPPLPTGMYYGCQAGVCGQRRCGIPNTADCNGELSDGCEAKLHTSENCNTCGDACAPGKQCLQITGNTYGCLCDDDEETLCGTACRRLDDDPMNCGGCDRVCPGAFLPHFSVTCTNGVCGGRCGDGYADCDGLTDNGCEVDTRIDNRNCGACGHACLPGQVCSAGKCLMAPCDAGAAGGPTK
ncbi:MAG: Tryptophan synthase alpha chain, partial [Labilithrix sp.]|nr:Tryptophan synthase alpha chain [Labilithrix sp.]